MGDKFTSNFVYLFNIILWENYSVKWTVVRVNIFVLSCTPDGEMGKKSKS